MFTLILQYMTHRLTFQSSHISYYYLRMWHVVFKRGGLIGKGTHILSREISCGLSKRIMRMNYCDKMSHVAPMLELADRHASEACARKGVEVRLLFGAHLISRQT